MFRMLTRAGWRHALRHPWQFGLSILGVALGVAVVVSIDAVNESAARGFEASANAVLGRTTHQVTGGSLGVPEDYYTRLRVAAGLRHAAPVVEGYLRTAGPPRLTLRLLGVDPFAERGLRTHLGTGALVGRQALRPLLTIPGALLLTRSTARELGLGVGDALQVEVAGHLRQVRLVGLLEAAGELDRRRLGDLAVCDIATAQELLAMGGRLSRIDLVLPDGAPGREQAARIRAGLPAGTALSGAAARTGGTVQMSAAFRLNLSMMSLLALVVGAFLIYNTMSFSVLQRRSLLGTLRALGVARGEVFRLVLGEALVVGAAGTVLGLAAGLLLADALLGLVTRTINDLYYVLTVREVAPGPWVFLKALALGVGATLAAAAVPALEASRVPPGAALSRAALETGARRLAPRAAVLGLLVLLASAGLLSLPGGGLPLGFAALFGVILGAALLAPGATVIAARLLRPLLAAGGVLGPMAARGVAAALSRTAVAIAALMVAISATVGVGIMVDSFRYSVVRWLETRLQADVYVSSPGLAANRSGPLLDAGLVARLAATPGVAQVSTGRHLEVESGSGPVRLTVLRMAPASRAGFRFLERQQADLWSDFEGRPAVLVSEPFAYRHGLGSGGAVALETPRGRQPFKVLGVYADYGSEQGVVVMSRSVYERYWSDSGVSALGLYLAPGVDADELVRRLKARTGDTQALLIRSNRALRDASLAVFDRTFTITLVLRVLAGVVAFIGVLSALMALELERAREMAVLRATGLTRGQVWGLVISQTGLLGLIAGALAVPLGAAMAWVLIRVINQRSFGWSLDVLVDPGAILQAPLLALGAALLAGVYPAWRMARTSPALALRGD